MINIGEIKKHYPGINGFERALLREYLQYKILNAIFVSKIGRKLSFLGGTALKIVYGGYRFSEDLDFDNFNLGKNEFEQMTHEIKRALDLEGYLTEIRNVYKGAFHCHIKISELLFNNNLSHMASEKLVIQVDTVPHNFKYEPKVYYLQKFDVGRNIKVTPIDILLSQKIAAIFGRKRTKGRDFYDVLHLINRTDFNYEYLDFKLGIKNKKELKEKLLSFCQDLNFAHLSEDVMPFLLKKQDAEQILHFQEYIEQEL
ncbi:MAG: nucleotidyl transferase AbiEii/AbiGii toxin family protein [Patescibacteria group bacterium]|nr:nucleotidyl transferase AbiEii/AbiGii toxin family protein [Patescibacteria group bacterium]